MNDSFAFTVQLKASRSSTVILGFHWVGELEVMVITNAGVEWFEVPCLLCPPPVLGRQR